MSEVRVLLVCATVTLIPFRSPSAEFIFPMSWYRAGLNWYNLYLKHVGDTVPSSLPRAAEYDEVYKAVTMYVLPTQPD